MAKTIEYYRAWRKANPGKSAAYTKKWRDNNRARSRELSRNRAKIDLLKIRSDIFAAYGNMCACCGESNREFMSIDHMEKGEGKLHRKLFKSSRRIYLHLKRLGYPKDKYRLLCFNCNMSHGIWGYCPHDRKHGL